MNVFLAGCEGTEFSPLVGISGHKYGLFSYHYWKKDNEQKRIAHRKILNDADMEVICDSGLFTMMFGAGKKNKITIESMREYTKEYISAAKKFKINNTTIVECDVHKLLGMKSVFELRKHFEDSKLKVMYVWHVEEGVDGLITMAKKYDYIAISVPELRIFFKGKQTRYQDAVFDLLKRIKSEVKTIPKIHLLGNTVQETMETTLAYSCDSTSWLSGGRYGVSVAYKNGKLFQVRKSSPAYIAWEKDVFPKYKHFVEQINRRYGHKEATARYMTANLFSAFSYKLYQEYLDKNYTWVGDR